MLLERWQRQRQQGDGTGQEERPERRPAGRRRERTEEERVLFERRQGLYWLAIVTALALWETGAVNNSIKPFQP